MIKFQFPQAFGIAAARGNNRQIILHGFKIVGVRTALAIDKLLADRVVVGAEGEAALPLPGVDQASGRDISLVVRHGGEYFTDRVCHLDFQFQPQIISKFTGQIIFKSGFSIRADIVGGGDVAGQNSQGSGFQSELFFR